MTDIDLTSSAAARVAAIAAKQGKPAILRLAVEGGGCSGFQYRFGLADAVEADDLAVERDGVTLVVDDVSLDLVRGSAVRKELVWVIHTAPGSGARCKARGC